MCVLCTTAKFDSTKGSDWANTYKYVGEAKPVLNTDPETTPMQDECKGVGCTKDLCRDGKGRRPIGDNCCACPEDECKIMACPMDLCRDGKGRRPIGDNCCACPEDECRGA